jgi:hypothetical protein
MEIETFDQGSNQICNKKNDIKKAISKIEYLWIKWYKQLRDMHIFFLIFINTNNNKIKNSNSDNTN